MGKKEQRYVTFTKKKCKKELPEPNENGYPLGVGEDGMGWIG